VVVRPPLHALRPSAEDFSASRNSAGDAAEPRDNAEREINALIARFKSAQATNLEQELFKQHKRLPGAERTLQTKVTRAATESQRIATDKIAWAKGKLADLQRTEPQSCDSRIERQA